MALKKGKEKGAKETSKLFRSLKKTEEYFALKLVFETVSDNVKRGLMEEAPQNAVTIAVLQAYAHLDRFLDLAVDNLSEMDLQEEINKQVERIRKQEKDGITYL